MKAALMISLSLLATLPSLAIGIFTLKGTLQKSTEGTVVVATKSIVYEIDRAGLSEDLQRALAKKQNGETVEFVVSTEYIRKAETRKKK